MRALLALAFAAALLGCTPSFRSRGPLAFKDLAYSGAAGQPWPEKRVALPTVSEGYHLPKPLEVAYVELNPGGKQTVVFIHGLGSYLKFWREQIDAFAAKGYRVIALDLPGYGKSDKPASFPYTMEAMADVVRELTMIAGASKPILVGHSMGGQTALSYAIRYPTEISALVLTSPAGFEEFSRREKDWLKKAVSVRFIKRADEYAVWGSVRRANFARFRPELQWLVEERVRLAQGPEFDSYAYANVRTIAGLADNDFVRQSLDKIRVPTIILYGDRDELIPNPFLHGGYTSTIMKYGKDHIAGSRLIELRGCGHTLQMDCPGEYNAAVLDFLGGVSP
jgi:pimeloyl-ACP methyl ester carboxylesterase